MSSEATPDIQINIKGPNELKLQINIATDKTVRELKEAVAEKSDVEADRQRLIYSGRVLKDDDPLTLYKIQSGHTIHMVKSAARSPGAASGPSTQSAPQSLPTMQAGQNPHDPLTQLNSHLGYGVMAGLNPFQDMGINPNDPNMLQTMMNSPQFLQQMANTMGNPQMIDQILASNPQLAAMGPQMREVFQSERFRQLISNPESLRAMLQMASVMRDVNPNGAPSNPFGGGMDSMGMGGMFGAPPQSSFPAPPTSASSGANTSSTDAIGGAGAGGVPAFDPAMLQQLMGAMGGAGSPGAGAGAGAGANPFAGLGAGGGGNPFGMFGGMGGGAAPPADTRSPEERFQMQLQQLQEMGFTNASQNIRALLATGGNVHSAIEYILGGGGL